MTGRVERWSRGLASLALLVGLVVGVPAALLVLGGNPVPRGWDPGGLWAALLRPDDGTVLARLLTLLGWAAWVVFTLSLLVELLNQVRRRSVVVVLPGLGGVQQWAAGLMLAVVALGGAAQLTTGPAAPVPAVARSVADPGQVVAPVHGPAGGGPAPVSTSAPDAAPRAPDRTSDPASAEDATTVPATATAPAGRRERIHVVATGDDLWSLAERYYGRGQDWRKIAAANPDRLTGGPDRLRVGWRLVVPDDRADDEQGEDGAERPSVRVRSGDTLTSIAERRLGDAHRWTELYRANRDRLSDPDELPVGLTLRLPSRTDEPAAATRDDARRVAESDAPVPAEEHPPAATPGSPPPTVPEVPAAPAPPVSTAPTAPTATTASATRPPPSEAAPTADAAADEDEDGPSLLVPGLATVGGLLAAALLGGLATRRRWQLQRRPVGRRIAHPPAATRSVEVALARRARPIGLRTLDRASRAVAASCAEAGIDVPALRSASVSPAWLVLEMAGPTPPAPRCFVDTGGAWSLAAEDVDGLRSVHGTGEAARPWPLLVTLGVDDEGAERILDLESVGLLAVTGGRDLGTAVLAAMALELACSPWTEDLRLTLVGDDRLGPALAQHNVQTTHDVDALLTRLEQVSRDRRAYGRGRDARTLRLDPDLGEAWTPEVVLVDVALTSDQTQRLVELTTSRPGPGLTAVVRGPVPAAPMTFDLGPDGRATLQPDGVRVVPQTLPVAGLDPVVALVVATGSDETHPAPWWSSADPPGPPPDNVTYLGRRRRTDERDEQERRAAVQARITDAAAGTARHPLLQLIGPVELVGAAGTSPARAAKQCLEYCAWLLEHPGASAQEMAAGLLVAEGTRRSNMSRLRSWLGSDEDGEPYLPDAYSGRIHLDPAVSSDWHQLRLLVGDGVDQAASSVLELGLRLVRGAPLADAAPVQWHWAEELRTDIVSCVRDIGVELARRCLDEGDLDLARWATARALVVTPGDELLLSARIRTEHLAGNAAETERLSLQLARQARTLGVDLDPATVDLIQEVMEGRVRARLA
ncbi:MAG: LysM peptidoglycan-binding domain-containing protein [Janthinobacterium lividum]